MNEQTGLIFGGVILFALIAVIAVILYKKSNPGPEKVMPREHGAQLAVNPARRFALSNSYKIIAPATLASGGKTAQLDAIVVGYFGVLGIKTLGYNGEVYGTASEENWVQIVNGERRTFPNPVTQAAADVRVIRDVLFGAKQKLVPVEVVCVFTDKKAQVAVPPSAGHYLLKDFKKLLQKDKYQEDKKVDLALVEQALRAALAP